MSGSAPVVLIDRLAGAGFFFALVAFAGARGRTRAAFRTVLPRAVWARRLPLRPRADARAPEPARFFVGVRFRPLLELFREDRPAFRRAAFFAMVRDPRLIQAFKAAV